MKNKYRVMKFDGDDMYSYAVFHAKDVKGLRSPVFYGEAIPIYSGMGNQEATLFKKRMESKTA